MDIKILKELSEKFDIDTKTIEEILIAGQVDEYNEGYDNGYDDGYDEGNSKGYDKGFDEGAWTEYTKFS